MTNHLNLISIYNSESFFLSQALIDLVLAWPLEAFYLLNPLVNLMP